METDYTIPITDIPKNIYHLVMWRLKKKTNQELIGSIINSIATGTIHGDAKIIVTSAFRDGTRFSYVEVIGG